MSYRVKIYFLLKKKKIENQWVTSIFAAFHFSYGNLTWENERKVVTDDEPIGSF